MEDTELAHVHGNIERGRQTMGELEDTLLPCDREIAQPRDELEHFCRAERRRREYDGEDN